MGYSKLFEQCRDVSLSASADCIEAIYRAKRNDPTCYGNRGRSDFLYDCVELHVDYVSRLARLGSAYSVYATRFLSAAYSAYLSPPRDPCPPTSARDTYSCPDLCFEGKGGEPCKRQVLLDQVASGEGVSAEQPSTKLSCRNLTETVEVRVDKLESASTRAGSKEKSTVSSPTTACEVTLTLPRVPGVWVGDLIISVGKLRTIQYTLIAVVKGS